VIVTLSVVWFIAEWFATLQLLVPEPERAPTVIFPVGETTGVPTVNLPFASVVLYCNAVAPSNTCILHPELL